jgi:hypothetical protein
LAGVLSVSAFDFFQKGKSKQTKAFCAPHRVKIQNSNILNVPYRPAERVCRDFGIRAEMPDSDKKHRDSPESTESATGSNVPFVGGGAFHSE